MPARRRPWTVLQRHHDRLATAATWSAPGRPLRSSGSRQDLQLAVLAEVVVVGDRADDPVLARPEVHARPHDLAGVRGRRAGVLLLLVLAERAVFLFLRAPAAGAVELAARLFVCHPSDVPRDDVDATRRDRDPLREDPV